MSAEAMSCPLGTMCPCDDRPCPTSLFDGAEAEVPTDAQEGFATGTAGWPDQGSVRPVPESALISWIAAVAEHDDRALAELYDATFPRVYAIVFRIVRNAALAEEVVGDAYYQVWRQASRFDATRGRALAWLMGMARSRAIDALRRESRFRAEHLNETTAAGDANAACADELLDVSRSAAGLHDALLQLDCQPRQLVSLSFFRGLSHEEIAQQTQLPLGTVKSQIRRALQSLRRILADRGVGPFAP